MVVQLLNYLVQGELVFVTSRTVKDVTVEEASTAIAGFTIGNDLTCRKHQMPEEGGGQFFFAKAFDKFAPMGPVLVSPEVLLSQEEVRIVTRVNGEVRQDADHKVDAVWSCAEVLSFMSNGTWTDPRTTTRRRWSANHANCQ